jgi:DNA-binding SARP family transcriptional activator/tetratricopeptide (TPR) repeat protein
VLTIGVLGPFDVTLRGAAVVVSAGRLRALLATLAMSAGGVVSVDRLAAAAWDDGLPADARRTVQIYVTRLRALLGRDLIATTPAGYQLRVDADQVDALRFGQLLDAAALAAGGPRERALLAEALALWRGTPFEGVRSATLAESEAPRLVERYLAAVERRVDLHLHSNVDSNVDSNLAAAEADVVGELANLTARYPLRETLWVRLLVVLARSGRQAEALERYEAVRSRLAAELGVDPGPELRAVYAELLAGRAPSSTTPAGAVAPPRQLPADIAGFTGRREALRALDALVLDTAPVAISAIEGTAGIGKSALAVHAAHRLAAHFPDGQLYVDLQGATPGARPLPPLEVLGRFLRALGVEPGAVPAAAAEASGLFRSRVAGRRLLVVLDNAADAGQVRPLLPSSGCAVLVTSRRALPALEGARHLRLDALAPDEAVELLSRVAGAARVAAELDAAADVARLCGGLPLTLRVVAARLAVRPAWSLAALRDRLAGARSRLDELDLGEVGVRASFAVSLDQLRTSGDPVDRRAAAAFAPIGLLDGPDFGVPVAAGLLAAPAADTERVLERLVDSHLLETPTPGRYRPHDVLRLYARETAERDLPERARAAALAGAYGYYIRRSWRTLEVLMPGVQRLADADPRWRAGECGFTDYRAALAWLETERANLLAAVEQAAGTPGVPASAAIQLAQGLSGFCGVTSRWHDLVRVNETALAAARRSGDLAARALAHHDLGTGHRWLGRLAEAAVHLRESIALHHELADRAGEAASLEELGCVHETRGDYSLAEACLRNSLACLEALGSLRGRADTLNTLGNVLERQARYAEALACYERSLALCADMDDRRAQGIVLSNLGWIHLRQGDLDRAEARLRDSLAIAREVANGRCEAYCLNCLGELHRRGGDLDGALARQQEALDLRRKLRLPLAEAESLHDLGFTLYNLGRTAAARLHWKQALAIYERLGSLEAGQVRLLVRSVRVYDGKVPLVPG